MTINNTYTALLPMKAHSERVPNKNIRDFCGKPLYQHVLKTLLSSKHIAEVLINTDSEVIADEASRLSERVRVIARPPELCGDFVPMNDIIAYDLSQGGAGHYLQTHSTNPLLRPETLDRAIETYAKGLGTYDSLFSVTRWQTRFYFEDGKPVNHKPRELLRTQDLPPLYEENSNIYLFSAESFREADNNRIGRRPQMFEIDRIESLDIDEEIDFKLAEFICRMGSHG